MIRDHKWFGWVVVSIYIGAIVLANYLITKYGQIALPFVAFAIIPFDLIARDLMQDRWQNEPTYVLRWRMLILILCGGLISIWTGTGSVRVNIASWLAFTVAGIIDALTYQWMIRYGRVFRINAATLTGAISDSVIFVTIAFSEVIWSLVGLQIGMKVAGGFVWSLLLYRFFRKPPSTPADFITANVRARAGAKCWMCYTNGLAICDCHSHPPGQPAAPCNLVCVTFREQQDDNYTINPSAASTGSLQDG